MNNVSRPGDTSLEDVMLSLGIDPHTVDGRVNGLMPPIGGASDASHALQEAAKRFAMARVALEGVFLTLRNGASGEMAGKNVALTRTVREMLMFDSLNLFPDAETATYRTADYAVTLVRENRRLVHSQRLGDAGVRANDTLEITAMTQCPTTRN